MDIQNQKRRNGQSYQHAFSTCSQLPLLSLIHFQTNVWQELLLAAIGEQFSKYMAEGDDVCGVSVRIRGFDNSIQIWNEDSELHSKSLVSTITLSLLCCYW